MIGAVILAAGEGERMGGVPKAAVELEGRTFLEWVVQASRDGGCRKLWAVVRNGVPDIESRARNLDVATVTNPDPERGMFSSVCTGLETALGDEPDIEGIVVFPVDHPRVRAETVGKIVRALEKKPPGIWIQPAYRGRPGHPIALDARALRLILEAEPTVTLRRALRESGVLRFLVPVADPHVLENLNRPEDL